MIKEYDVGPASESLRGRVCLVHVMQYDPGGGGGEISKPRSTEDAPLDRVFFELLESGQGVFLSFQLWAPG